jgi:hypothetical protein
MRQAPNGKRSRNRPGRNNNRPQQSRNHSYDSSGPEGKVRGTANQVYDKYLALARDASSSGDRIMAENYFQHAEHYFRIMNVNGQQVRPRPEFSDDSAAEATEASANTDASAQPQPRGEALHNEQPNAVAPAAEASGDGDNGSEPATSKPETPAQLAQAAAANEGRPRGRRRGPRFNGGATAEA